MQNGINCNSAANSARIFPNGAWSHLLVSLLLPSGIATKQLGEVDCASSDQAYCSSFLTCFFHLTKFRRNLQVSWPGPFLTTELIAHHSFVFDFSISSTSSAGLATLRKPSELWVKSKIAEHDVLRPSYRRSSGVPSNWSLCMALLSGAWEDNGATSSNIFHISLPAVGSHECLRLLFC